MLEIEQIIFRLILSLVFGFLIGWLKKKEEEIFDLKIYPRLAFLSAALILFSLQVFSKIYSKIELLLLPAVFLFGFFLVSRHFWSGFKNSSEELLTFIHFLLTIIIGFSLGAGLYQLAIILTVFFLVISSPFSYNFPIKDKIKKKIKEKIWPRQK